MIDKRNIDRSHDALETRIRAAKIALRRNSFDKHTANGDEATYTFAKNRSHAKPSVTKPSVKGEPSSLLSYTKGLPHNEEDGLVYDPAHFELFVKAIDAADPELYIKTPLGPEPVGLKGDDFKARSGYTQQVFEDFNPDKLLRAWESEGAGQIFDLEGPDAQAETMPPAPSLSSVDGGDEFIAEVAEVYEMALLRDVPFSDFATSKKVAKSLERLNQLPHFKHTPITVETLFRGFTKGDKVGPYLSQFLCQGVPVVNDPRSSADIACDGDYAYGSLRLDHRVRKAQPRKDYMTTWEWWLDVQHGANLGGQESYLEAEGKPEYGFISTPRDLATYVHYDALYEAYLNACLMLLAHGAAFDPHIPFQADNRKDHQQGFAHFGGPHILSLVTEVATRALKAVRFQKFNVHRRLRPEAVGGRLHRYLMPAGNARANLAPIATLADEFARTGLLHEVKAHNAWQNAEFDDGRQQDASAQRDSYLLPMAFPEGSPMHPAYGAGHATVAGACVTVLKAFFDTDAALPGPYVEPTADGTLQTIDIPALSIGNELDKLAANISIARNWAGVHYYTDYSESLRLGEKIALGILEEQAITFNMKEYFGMTVPLFDNQTVLKLDRDGFTDVSAKAGTKKPSKRAKTSARS